MAKPIRPGKKRLTLAAQALPKAHTQRTAAERRAVRLTKAWRQAHPNWNKKGAGGGGGDTTSAGAPGPLDMLTTQQIGQQALGLAQGDILQETQAVEREQTQLAQQGLQQEHLIGNLSQELGGLTAGIAPSIQTAYRQAANDQAAAAQGFSGGMQDIASAEAARNAAQLEQLGAPQQQIANIQGQGAGAGDVLYGQGGYLPATSLGQQGAAFEAFGAMMPGIAARMGQQDVADVSANTRAGQKQLADRAADIAATLPSLRRQYVQTLLGHETDKASLRTAAAGMGLDAATLAETIRSHKAGEEIDWASLAAQNQPEPPDPKDTATYQRNMGKTMQDVLDAMIKAHVPSASISPTGVIIPAESDKAKTKVRYARAFSKIYSSVKAQYGTPRGGWRYGYKDSEIRKMIKNFLIGQGVKPKPKPRPGPIGPVVPSLGGPYPTAGSSVFPGAGLGQP